MGRQKCLQFRNELSTRGQWIEFKDKVVVSRYSQQNQWLTMTIFILLYKHTIIIVDTIVKNTS